MGKTLFILAFLMTCAVVTTVVQVQANDEIPAEVTLFKNVNIFDGKSDSLMTGVRRVGGPQPDKEDRQGHSDFRHLRS